jgi:hypothetical protein
MEICTDNALDTLLFSCIAQCVDCADEGGIANHSSHELEYLVPVLSSPPPKFVAATRNPEAER